MPMLIQLECIYVNGSNVGTYPSRLAVGDIGGISLSSSVHICDTESCSLPITALSSNEFSKRVPGDSLYIVMVIGDNVDALG